MEFRATQIQAAVMFTWQLDTQIQTWFWKAKGLGRGCCVILLKKSGF